MPATRLNAQRVKIHRTYTVEEIARLFELHRNTVRAWLQRGLPSIDQRRPILILGTDLRAFLDQRRAVRKAPCAPGELYCVKCRSPRRPLGDHVLITSLTNKVGSLIGRCPDCNTELHRRISLARLEAALGSLVLLNTLGEEHIGESRLPVLNCDFTPSPPTHAKTQS